MTPDEIKSIRINLGVTQEKFAQLLGTTVVTVNRWENGKTKPSRMSIKEIKEIKANYGSYTTRRKKFEDT